VSLELLTFVRLGVIELAEVTEHVLLAFIAHVLELELIAVVYLLIEHSVIGVFANYCH
jgi:hypothetical protein